MLSTVGKGSWTQKVETKERHCDLNFITLATLVHFFRNCRTTYTHYNKRPVGLDTLRMWWPVIKGLAIMHLWCKQEASTPNCYWLKAKCLQENLTLIPKWAHIDLIFEQEIEHDNRHLIVCFDDDRCNDISIIWISSHRPLISIENVYCHCDLDRCQTNLVDVC